MSLTVSSIATALASNYTNKTSTNASNASEETGSTGTANDTSATQSGDTVEVSSSTVTNKEKYAVLSAENAHNMATSLLAGLSTSVLNTDYISKNANSFAQLLLNMQDAASTATGDADASADATETESDATSASISALLASLNKNSSSASSSSATTSTDLISTLFS